MWPSGSNKYALTCSFPFLHHCFGVILMDLEPSNPHMVHWDIKGVLAQILELNN